MNAQVQQLRSAATGVPIEKPRDIGGLSKFVAAQMKQIKSVIASTLTPEKMARIALNELRTKDGYLLKCALSNPEAFVNAIVQAAHLGLEIGGALGQAYLVPYKGEIKLIVGYRGLISLARRSGEISSINAEIVYENDEFDLELGIDTKVKHRPRLTGPRGHACLVYMVAHFKDGGSHFEWMTIDEVMNIKSRSASVGSGKKSPWDTDESEMIRKTVIRRGWKYLPMSIEMKNAAAIEAANEQGSSVVIDGDAVVVTDDPQSVDQATGEILDRPSRQIEHQPDPERIPQQTRQAEREPVRQQQAEQATQQHTGNAQGQWEPSAEELAEIAARERAEAAQGQSSASAGGRRQRGPMNLE